MKNFSSTEIINIIFGIIFLTSIFMEDYYKINKNDVMQKRGCSLFGGIFAILVSLIFFYEKNFIWGCLSLFFGIINTYHEITYMIPPAITLQKKIDSGEVYYCKYRKRYIGEHYQESHSS